MTVAPAAPPPPRSPSPTSMRAARIVEPGRLELAEAPVPEPAAGEVLIAVESCGVCVSNVPRWEGKPWFTYPSEPGELGHEGVGRIVTLGPGVSGFAPGDRVAFLSNHAYAAYDVASAEQMVPVPAALADRLVVGEPLACAWNVFQRAAIRPGDAVAVVGVGFLGALVAQLAVQAGARVLLVARRPLADAIAEVTAGCETVVHEDWDVVVQAAQTFAGGRLCDVVIEAAGKQGPLDLAGRLTRERGRLVIAGYHQDGARQVDMQLWNWRGLDVINAHERETAVYVEGMRRAFAAVLAGTLRPDPMFTHVLPLERLDEALELARVRPPGFVKAIVQP